MHTLNNEASHGLGVSEIELHDAGIDSACACSDAKWAAVAGRRWLAEDASGLMPVASRQRFPQALAVEL